MSNPLRKIRDHFLRDLIDRINDLETGIRVLVSSPAYRHEESGAFNALRGRRRIFEELTGRFRFAHLVETGTYLGETTGYMASATGLPVHSCERNPSLHALARHRLKGIPGIALANMDSRAFLLELSQKPDIVEAACFLYLDAHWGRDVPLNEEIGIIASRWKQFVVMIDDFEVPGDAGYTHGSYGTLQRIGMAGLRAAHGLCAYFPATPSSAERPGAPGCVLLAKDDAFASPLAQMTSIRRHAA